MKRFMKKFIFLGIEVILLTSMVWAEEQMDKKSENKGMFHIIKVTALPGTTTTIIKGKTGYRTEINNLILYSCPDSHLTLTFLGRKKEIVIFDEVCIPAGCSIDLPKIIINQGEKLIIEPKESDIDCYGIIQYIKK